jgi:hypothetical protein
MLTIIAIPLIDFDTAITIGAILSSPVPAGESSNLDFSAGWSITY